MINYTTYESHDVPSNEVLDLKDSYIDKDPFDFNTYTETEPIRHEETKPSIPGLTWEQFSNFANSSYLGNLYTSQKVSKNEMVNYFVNKGLTYNQARGLVGNIMYESGGGIPDIVQGGKRGSLKIDGKTGFGLSQWTSKDRQQKLYDFSGTYNPTYKQQLDFIWWELNNTHSKALADLKKTTTIEDATKSVMDKYEAPDPKVANYKQRLKFAKEV